MIDREIILFLQSLQEQFEASSLLKPFFPFIALFGYKSIDTNILVVDPKIGDSSAFVFGRQLRSYYEQFIWKTPSVSKENEVKDTLQGNEVSQYILQQLHTPIANGFKLACESGCVPSSE